MRFLFPIFTICILLSLASCSTKQDKDLQSSPLRFEQINQYKYPIQNPEQRPYAYRLEYYFDNGKSHRWLVLDSLGQVTTDYIYRYDSNWVHTGAIYKEFEDSLYSREQVRFENDSTQITEWLDEHGKVYYQMVDQLNRKGKTYRATFVGDETHGYDSTFYTPEGFVKRIFFTNVKGKRMNDRSFRYDSVNARGDWLRREKIMGDSIQEVHIREVYYDEAFTNQQGEFYKGILSTREWQENEISFTRSEDTVFFTRTKNWTQQTAFISTKKNGLYMPPEVVAGLENIYNGSISPSGNKIIYGTRTADEIFLMEKEGEGWGNKVNLTATSGIKGAYFHWINEEELYFYTNENDGDLVGGKLENQQLIITDSLPPLNTPDGTEFSPYLPSDKSSIFFTSYLEGDPNSQGIFLSLNEGTADQPSWSIPRKAHSLPYAWGAYVTSTGFFLYTDGENFYQKPLKSLLSTD